MGRRLAVVALLGVSLLLHLRFFAEPLERDEGAYALVAARILAGSLPYRDVFDHKPPAIHYAYALAFAVLGPSEQAVRLLGAAAGLLATAAAGWCARRLFGPPAGLAALAVATPLLALPQLQATMANTEVFLAPLVALHAGLAWTAVGRRSARLAFGAGFAAGLAALFKPVAAASLAAGIAFEALRRTTGWGRRSVLAGLGFAAPWLAVLALFAASGALSDLWRDVFAYNLGYIGPARAPVQETASLLRPFLTTTAAFSLLAAGGLAAALGEDRRGPGLLAGLWVAFSLAGVAASGRYYPHYFVQALPPLAVLGGRGVAWFAARRGAALGLALVAGVNLARTGAWFLRSPEAASRAKYGEEPLAARRLGLDLKGRLVPGATVLVWGFAPQVAFYAGARGPGRFVAATAAHTLADAFAGPAPDAIVVADGAPEDERLAGRLAGFEPAGREGPFEVWLPAGNGARPAGGRLNPAPCGPARRWEGPLPAAPEARRAPARSARR